MILFVVLPFETDDRKFKTVKYASALAWLLFSAVGIFVTNPWCVLMGDELDYSSLVGFLAVVSGTLIVTSAWCRYLCPMGAALGLLARYAPFKVANSKTCEKCGDCAGVCPTGAIRDAKVDQGSCIYCANCIGVCEFHWVNELAQTAIPASGRGDSG